MDDTKKKRLAALKAEIEYGAKPPHKQKEKLDLWDELNLNKPMIAEKPPAAVPPMPIEAVPIPKLAVIAPTISAKPEPANVRLLFPHAPATPLKQQGREL
jgi:hypothetical protein